MTTPFATLKNIATQLRIDSVRSTARRAADIRRRACRPRKSWRRCFSRRCTTTRRIPQNLDNDRFVLSKGHAAPILYAAWAEAGPVSARGSAEAAPHRFGSRRPSDAAPAVRRRRDGIARPGDLRRDRHGAERAAHRFRIPHLRAARRRRDGRRVRVGGGATSPSTTSSTTCAASSTSTARPEPPHAVRPQHGGDRGALDARSGGTPIVDRRPRHRRAC